MYPVSTPRIVILDRVRQDPLAEARLERMVGAIEADEIIETDDAGLAEVLTSTGLADESGRTGSHHISQSPTMIFGTYRWDQDDEIRELGRRFPVLNKNLLLGQNPWTFRDHRMYGQEHGQVCQSGFEVHGAYGCLHACDYCFIAGYFAVMLDLETLTDRLRRFGDGVPDQQLYKFDNYTDTITLEPEYGASEAMVSLFADWPDRYLLLYTKSDNVEHLLDLDHRGKTLVSWSLAPESVARDIEKRTPGTDARIGAMERCEAAGYPVRARLSPICPVRGWRAEYGSLIERLMTRVHPEVVTIDVLGWMTGERMQDAIDTELFDERFAAEVDRQAREGAGVHGKHLFPHALRAELLRFAVDEIRRHRPDQSVALCNETREMWRELEPELGVTPADALGGHYACCCGPTSVPGNPLLTIQAG